MEVGICDDNPEDIERIRSAIYRCMETLGETDVTVYQFHHTRELYEACGRRVFHLLFLDVMMQELEWSGFDLASRLCMNESETKVVFVSNFESMAFDSYEYMPLWFVRKSQLERDMLRALWKYQQEAARKRVNYQMKDSVGYKEVPVHDIVYVEGIGHTLSLWMSDQKSYQIYGSLMSMEKELSKFGFIRIYKNYLVNMRYIAELGKKKIRLRDGAELDMGRARKKKIEEALAHYKVMGD